MGTTSKWHILLGLPKWSPEIILAGLPELWTAITPDCKVRSQQGLNQSCSPCRDLFNAVSHSQFGRREQVDSRLLMVGSQTANLTPGPSFAYNLGWRCPNCQSRPFSISTFQDLSNDTKNAPMRGVLGLSVELWTFESPGGLQVPNFGSVGLHPHTWPKWGCDINYVVKVVKPSCEQSKHVSILTDV